MSATAATARYVIAADDKTKSAIASINAGFKNMERGIKGTVTRMNAALGILAGVGLKRAFHNVFNETAKGSKEFAFALDEVRRSARNLLAAKDGAPAAAAAMRELATVLKDPEVVETADKLASVLIRGFAGTVKFATGVKTIREEIEALKRQRDQLANEESQPRGFIKGEPTLMDDRAMRIFRMNAEIKQKEQQEREQELAAAKRIADQWARIEEAGNRAARRFQTMREFQENIRFLENLEKEGTDTEFFEKLIREADFAAVKLRQNFFEQVEDDAIRFSEKIDEEGSSFLDGYFERMEAAREKTSQWAIVSEQAARNIHDAFANWLFDPFSDGLDGMLKGFLDVLRRMIAEAAAAQIFGSKESGGFGFGDFLGGLFGLATTDGSGSSGVSGPRAVGGGVNAGKLYRVNEDQMEFFRPSHSGDVIPLSKMGGRGVGSAISVVNHITFHNVRDASDAKMALWAQRISDATVARLRDSKRRGTF